MPKTYCCMKEDRIVSAVEVKSLSIKNFCQMMARESPYDFQLIPVATRGPTKAQSLNKKPYLSSDTLLRNIAFVFKYDLSDAVTPRRLLNQVIEVGKVHKTIHRRL